MKKEPIVFLTHSLESINLIEMYVRGVTEEYFHTSIEKQDLVVRRLEIIGEATKNLPDEFRKKHSDIPWKRMAGLRDVIIHQYFGIEYNIIWDTVVSLLPILKKQIEQLIQDYSSKEN
ncbi:MAG TPA: DUF86 domain-containing protein [Ktedonobacteraceae bacterium]|jgi:uncharacterized protein with HEPN domain